MGGGGPFSGVQRPGREADHSPPASAEVKKMWIYTSTLPYAFMAKQELARNLQSRKVVTPPPLKCSVSLSLYPFPPPSIYSSDLKGGV
jgi:hypothetical protein